MTSVPKTHSANLAMVVGDDVFSQDYLAEILVELGVGAIQNALNGREGLRTLAALPRPPSQAKPSAPKHWHACAVLADLALEGVETAEQMKFLRDMGTTIVQGYHLARPMPFEACTTWLQQHGA